MDPTMPPHGGPGAPVPPPLPTYYPSPAPFRQPFTLGSILGEVFSIYKENFLAFVLITALVSIPTIVTVLILAKNPLVGGIAALISMVTGPIGAGAITYGVYEYLSGRQTTIADCLRVGFSKVLPVLGVALLTGLIVAAGMVACIVPGIIAYMVFAVAVPVAIQERVGVLDALRRSSTLTEGHRWDIFGVFFVLGIIMIAVTLPVNMIFIFGGHPERAQLAAQVIQVLVGGLTATAPAVMYYRLRSAKESIDVRDIASVFD
jgi:hypothetical protein